VAAGVQAHGRFLSDNATHLNRQIKETRYDAESRL
jgi:hypothetical protein